MFSFLRFFLGKHWIIDKFFTESCLVALSNWDAGQRTDKKTQISLEDKIDFPLGQIYISVLLVLGPSHHYVSKIHFFLAHKSEINTHHQKESQL